MAGHPPNRPVMVWLQRHAALAMMPGRTIVRVEDSTQTDEAQALTLFREHSTVAAASSVRLRPYASF